MLLLTELDDIDREEIIRSWKTGVSVSLPLKAGTSTTVKQKRVNYVESSESESSKNEIASDEDSDQENSQDDGESIGSTEEDEELGESGSNFTIAEMRVLAKFIATKPGWLKKGYREWGDFFTMVSVKKADLTVSALTLLFGTKYPQRSAPSWREYYRRKQTGKQCLIT